MWLEDTKNTFTKIRWFDIDQFLQFTLLLVETLRSQVKLLDWSVKKYAEKVGFGFNEYCDKFESLSEIINSDSKSLKEKDLPCDLRRYLLQMNERLRRGVVTFQYLESRNAQKIKSTR